MLLLRPHYYFLSLWANRNHKIHQASDITETTACQARIQALVRERHSRSSSLPRSDLQAYFSEPLSLRLLRPPYVLEAWIVHVDRIFIRHRKEINQRTATNVITNYLTRAPFPNQPTAPPT